MIKSRMPGMANMIRDAYAFWYMGTPLLRVARFATFLFVFAGCATRNHEASSVYAEAARNDPRGRPYVIGASDVIRVTVWKDPNLSTDAVVRPDGTITLPLIGEVVATGRTAVALQ